MTVSVDGERLTIADVVRVARGGERVELAPEAVARIAEARAFVERVLERGDEVYGLTTGVGARKVVRVSPEEEAGFNRRMLLNTLIAQGPEAPEEVVRAMMLRLLNGFAKGTSGVRPVIAERVVDALNGREHPRVRMLGSLGQADLGPMSDLAVGIVGDELLAAKDAIALCNSNAFSTGIAALAVHDARRLLESLDVAGALDLEGFAGNVSSLHPAVGATRPYPGLQATLERLRSLLEGSYLWEPGAARNLQDPLTFRCLPQIHGAVRDALEFTERQLAIELNASQENPLLIPSEDRIVSVANFDVTPLALVLDFLRLALGAGLTAADERMVKLLEAPFSGLPPGLAVREGLVEDSLIEYGVAGPAITSEARLLAQPVTLELATSSHQEGIEDRSTMAPLAARRLAEMVGLGERVLALELVVAAQAVELRGPPTLGTGTGPAYAAVREVVPFNGEGDPLPDVEPLLEPIRAGAFARPS